MFDNTFTLNLDGADRVLTRVNQDKFSSIYRYRSDEINAELLIRHTDRALPGASGIRVERHNVELTCTTFSTTDGVKIANVAKAYFVFETSTGSPVAIPQDMLTALAAAFMTDAVVARLANWES